MDLRIYYQNRRAKCEELARQCGKDCVVVSLPNPNNAAPGAMVECSVENAAKVIVERSHRLATAQESAEFYRQRDAATARCSGVPPARSMQ